MNPRTLLPLYFVEKRYVTALLQFADCVSERHIGRPVGLMHMIETWANWEQEYARRGFRAIPLENAVNSVVNEESLQGLLRQRLLKGEQPILHAEYVKGIGFEDKPFESIDEFFG